MRIPVHASIGFPLELPPWVCFYLREQQRYFTSLQARKFSSIGPGRFPCYFPVRISSVIWARVIRPSSRLVFAPYWCIIAVTWSLSRYSLACENISVALSSAPLSVFCVLATEVSALVSASEDSDESSCCLPFFEVPLGALPPLRWIGSFIRSGYLVQ